MTAIILTAIAVFIATGFDELVVLTILFVYANEKKLIKDIYIGQQIGMIALLTISVLAVFGIQLISQKWIGVLGFLPIIQGIRFLINGDDDDDDDEVIEKTGKFKNLILSVAVIAIAGGGEELAIYIPYFSSLTTKNLIITLITFNILVPVWCTFCRKVSDIKYIGHLINKYEKLIVPIVFILIGIFVLFENNFFIAVKSLF